MALQLCHSAFSAVRNNSLGREPKVNAFLRESSHSPQSRKAASVVLRRGLRTRTRTSTAGGRKGVGVISARQLRPVVERFKIQHEKNVSEERLKELGVSRWSKWECGPCVTYFWKWQADELVYVAKGSVEVVPDGCEDGAYFYAGDLVLFPKWFEASLTFEEDYEQCYKFLAYGD